MFRLWTKREARDLFFGGALLAAAALLLLFPQESLAAAREGLSLCGNVIIPSLFPFFILSSLVVELGLASYLGRLLEPIMRPLFRVSGACASALALGFVGGYPVGARTAIALYRNGDCSKVEAERLLAFCNNSGPAFVLGVVGAGVFASSGAGVMLYLAHAAASLCVGLLFRFYGRRQERESPAGYVPRFEAKRFSFAFTSSVGTALQSTLNICAFVVFFTVVIRLLFRSGALSSLARLMGLLLGPLGFSQGWAERLLTGLIELSSGVSALSGGGALGGRLTMAAFMLGWAGLSVHCQVLSFLGDSGLSIRTYFLGKLLHGGLAALFTGLLVRVLPLETAPAAALAEQVEVITGMDFRATLTLSVAAAWVVGVCFLLLALAALRKSAGKRRPFII
ncbi:MAG: sporulation protein [Clostridiales bacterium]|nr:sporulation protein [Clostridiales bacterium]